MKKGSTFLMIVILAASILVSACSSKSTEATAAPAESQPQGLVSEGRLAPANSLEQSFAISGQVAEVMVKDGDSVKIGQALARLNDSPEAQAALTRARQEALAAQLALDSLKASADINLAQSQLNYEKALTQVEDVQDLYDKDNTAENKASLDLAKANLELAKDTLDKLKNSNGLDPDQLKAAQSRLDSANASVASAQSLLEAQVLKSTMDGAIVDLSLQTGQKVSAGVPVIVIGDFSYWLVQTDNLTEKEVTKIKIGQSVEVVMDALPGTRLNGQVTHINTRYVEKRGDITYTVTIQLKDTDPLLRWGMTAAVYFKP